MTEFIQNNWFWILVVLFIGMYLFGGGCGMGHHGKRKNRPDEESKGGEGKSCH